MKRILYLFLIVTVLFSINVSAQQLEPKVVVNKHTFLVHSVTYSLFSDEYRSAVRIDLPPNTVEWFYAVSTFNLQSTSQSSGTLLNGLGSLVGKADPVSGVALSALGSHLSTVTESECHIYLLDELNKNSFMDYDSFQYYEEGTRERFNGGTAAIKDNKFLSGTWYLGFENPKTKDGVKIELEVVALVKTNKPPQQNQSATSSQQISDVTITDDPDVEETEINIYNNTEHTLRLFFDGNFMEDIPPMESTAYDTENATYKVKCIQKGGSASWNYTVKFTKNGQSAEIVIGE
ncbi:MAG: hypothetical protein II852_01100 [Bacteroidales bacterium]|jgi:hypothetical protein|nr:hypothetical protein [Bacteroidales bacterium]